MHELNSAFRKDSHCAMTPAGGLLELYQALLRGEFNLGRLRKEVVAHLTGFDVAVALVGGFMQSHLVLGIKSPNPDFLLAEARMATQPVQHELENEVLNTYSEHFPM